MNGTKHFSQKFLKEPLIKKYSKETWAHAQYVSDKNIINIKNFKARFYLMEIKHY